MRMRQMTFKSIVEVFALPEEHLQMLDEASTVFVDMQTDSAGKRQDVLSVSSPHDQGFLLRVHRIYDTEQLYLELAVQCEPKLPS
jgi:hypothetical protein